MTPADQAKLTPEALDEDETVILRANDPNAPDNVVLFSYELMEYHKVPVNAAQFRCLALKRERAYAAHPSEAKRGGEPTARSEGDGSAGAEAASATSSTELTEITKDSGTDKPQSAGGASGKKKRKGTAAETTEASQALLGGGGKKKRDFHSTQRPVPWPPGTGIRRHGP